MRGKRDEQAGEYGCGSLVIRVSAPLAATSPADNNPVTDKSFFSKRLTPL